MSERSPRNTKPTVTVFQIPNQTPNETSPKQKHEIKRPRPAVVVALLLVAAAQCVAAEAARHYHHPGRAALGDHRGRREGGSHWGPMRVGLAHALPSSCDRRPAGTDAQDRRRPTAPMWSAYPRGATKSERHVNGAGEAFPVSVHQSGRLRRLPCGPVIKNLQKFKMLEKLDLPIEKNISEHNDYLGVVKNTSTQRRKTI